MLPASSELSKVSKIYTNHSVALGIRSLPMAATWWTSAHKATKMQRALSH